MTKVVALDVGSEAAQPLCHVITVGTLDILGSKVCIRLQAGTSTLGLTGLSDRVLPSVDYPLLRYDAQTVAMGGGGVSL